MKRIAFVLVLVMVFAMVLVLPVSAYYENSEVLADIFMNQTNTIEEMNELYQADIYCKFMLYIKNNNVQTIIIGYLDNNDGANIYSDRLRFTNIHYYYVIDTYGNLEILRNMDSSHYFIFRYYPDVMNSFIYSTSDISLNNGQYYFPQTLPTAPVIDYESIWQNRPSYSQAKSDANSSYDFDTSFMLENEDGLYIYYYNQNDSVYTTRITNNDYTANSNSTLQLQATGTNSPNSNRCVVYTVDTQNLTYSPVGIDVPPVLYVIPNSSPDDILYASSNLLNPDGTVLFPPIPLTPAEMGETIRGLIQEQMIPQLMTTVQVIVITAVSCLVSLILFLLLPKVLRRFLKR